MKYVVDCKNVCPNSIVNFEVLISYIKLLLNYHPDNKILSNYFLIMIFLQILIRVFKNDPVWWFFINNAIINTVNDEIADYDEI